MILPVRVVIFSRLNFQNDGRKIKPTCVYVCIYDNFRCIEKIVGREFIFSFMF